MPPKPAPSAATPKSDRERDHGAYACGICDGRLVPRTVHTCQAHDCKRCATHVLRGQTHACRPIDEPAAVGAPVSSWPRPLDEFLVPLDDADAAQIADDIEDTIQLQLRPATRPLTITKGVSPYLDPMPKGMR